MIYSLDVLYSNVKEMIKDVVSYSCNNYAYILPLGDYSKPTVGFRCKRAKKEWKINVEDWKETMTEEERLILESCKTRVYFCRAASCRMYESFHKEIQTYISSEKWHDNLSLEEKRYVHLIKRYYYLVRKFEDN
jgi:hypothetical protein